MNISSG